MNLDVLFNSSLVVQLHIYAALLAFFLGLIVLWRRKGNTVHKRWGKIWVVLMALTAVTSFFINEIRNVGPFSFIHLISIGTLFSLFVGVRQAQNKQIDKHQSSMKATFLGGMVIAGGLAFMPGRRMYEIAIEPTVALINIDLNSNGIFGSANFSIAFAFLGLLAAVLIIYRKPLLKRVLNWKVEKEPQNLL